MAVLAMAISDSKFPGVNPIIVIPAIIKTPLHYLVACLFLGIVVGFYWVGAFGLVLVLPKLAAMALSSCVWLYFMMVMSRVLGLLYYYNRERLGWIRHH